MPDGPSGRHRSSATTGAPDDRGRRPPTDDADDGDRQDSVKRAVRGAAPPS
jgi:hypothetical protein